jgi:hypothetical protein
MSQLELIRGSLTPKTTTKLKLITTTKKAAPTPKSTKAKMSSKVSSDEETAVETPQVDPQEAKVKLQNQSKKFLPFLFIYFPLRGFSGH